MFTLVAHTLFNSILLYLELEDHTRAKEYSEKLQQLEERTNVDFIKNLTRLVDALILSQSTRLSNKGKAQMILTELIGEEQVDYTVKVHAYLQLCELHLFELKASEDESVIGDITSILDELTQLATQLHLDPILVKTQILQSKLSLLNGDISTAELLLDEAFTLSVDKNLSNLKNQIIVEQEKLEKQFERWQEITSRNYSISERLRMTEIQNYINNVKQLF
jgi:hypothetical protein